VPINGVVGVAVGLVGDGTDAVAVGIAGKAVVGRAIAVAVGRGVAVGREVAVAGSGTST